MNILTPPQNNISNNFKNSDGPPASLRGDSSKIRLDFYYTTKLIIFPK